MNRFRGGALVGILAGLSAAGAVCAQTPPDPAAGASQPAPANPVSPTAPVETPDQGNSATYPSSTAPGNGKTPAQNADPHAAARQHQKSAERTAAASGNSGSITSGMDVQSSSGQTIGTVADVVKNPSGRPTYVVVADQSGNDTAIPYEAARQMVHGNRVVVDAARLQSAPKVPRSQLQNPANTGWQEKAEGFWRQPPR